MYHSLSGRAAFFELTKGDIVIPYNGIPFTTESRTIKQCFWFTKKKDDTTAQRWQQWCNSKFFLLHKGEFTYYLCINLVPPQISKHSMLTPNAFVNIVICLCLYVRVVRPLENGNILISACISLTNLQNGSLMMLCKGGLGKHLKNLS